MADGDEDYLALAASAEKAADHAKSPIARNLLRAIAKQYRELAEEQLRQPPAKELS